MDQVKIERYPSVTPKHFSQSGSGEGGGSESGGGTSDGEGGSGGGEGGSNG